VQRGTIRDEQSKLARMALVVAAAAAAKKEYKIKNKNKNTLQRGSR